MAEEIEEHLQKLITDENDAHNITVFRRLYAQYRSEPSKIDWAQMNLLGASRYVEHGALEAKLCTSLTADAGATSAAGGAACSTAGAVLKRLVVVKLNGGLGTTMHCRGPKSLIELRDGLTFLDFVLLQNQKLNERYDSAVPLLLMNSFNTHADTLTALGARPAAQRANVRTFAQSRCPRIFADSLRPVPGAPDDRPDDGWYPPGHGNVFESMAYTGVLDELLAEGRDIAFFSNIDNTGASVDLAIAAAMCGGGGDASIADYLMEVTNRTVTDTKGGAVIEYKGALMHLEMPQVPANKIEEFCSLRTFTIFNTNNIWVNLRAVKAKISQLKMEILANHKRLSAADNFREIIQLETSVGGAIRNFERAICLRVARRRFLPVKSTQEMLPLMSNAYRIDPVDYVIKLNGDDFARRPIAILSAREFAPVREFHAHFAAVPDMSELQSLRVSGDVRFGENVKLIGNVVIEAKEGEKIYVEDGSTLSG